jgi:hypothetical protein
VRLLLLLASGLAACSRPAPTGLQAAPSSSPSTPPATSTTPPTPPPPPAGPVEARFTHGPADTWTADYTFASPVAALSFRRPRIPRDTWRVVDPPGATLSGAILSAPAPFSRLRIILTTAPSAPEREYRPFTRYSDRGLLVYTGQLLLTGASGTLTLAAAPGESVVVPGQSPAPQASLTMQDEGTYAYFGDLAPVETPSASALVDHATPDWMRDRVTTDISRVFALYAARLGPLQGPRPTVFLSFTPLDHGRSLGGGVLPPHVLALDLELDRALAATDSPATRFDVDQLVAHEAAHFWNSDQHPVGGDAHTSWLHEGTADALALRALHTIGAMTDAAYRDALSEAASECALWLSGGEPLTSSTRSGHARAFYVCGSTLQLIVEAACRRRDPKADLFTFWRTVLDDARPGYDEDAFLRTLDRLGADPDVTATVRRIVHERLDDASGTLRGALLHVGLPTAATAAGASLPDAYEQHASIPEALALLPHACAASLLFEGDSEVQPRVGEGGACPGLPAGARIESLAGVPVGPRGATSYAAAYASCRDRHTVDVFARGASVTVPCDPSPRPPPVAFTLQKAP